MKLNKLIEQDEPIPSDMSSEEDIKVNARDMINKTIKKWKNNYIFDKSIDIPEGKLRLNCLFDEAVEYKNHSERDPKRARMEFGLTYHMNMNPKPIIPRDFLATAVSNFMDDINKINPNIHNNTDRYPMDVLNEYDVRFYSVMVYPSEGIIDLYNFIPRNLYNIKIKGYHKFGDLLRNRSHLLNVYTFDEGVIPKFSNDYSSKMEKSVRHCRVVYNVLKKGKWGGEEYDLGIFKVNNVIVHQNRNDYSIENNVIQPDFDLSYSGEYPTLNGKRVDTIESEVKDAFMEFIKQRFKQFRIRYS